VDEFADDACHVVDPPRFRLEKVHPGNDAPLLSLCPGDYPDEAPNAERTVAHVLIDDD